MVHILRADKQVLLAAVAQEGLALQCASADLRAGAHTHTHTHTPPHN